MLLLVGDNPERIRSEAAFAKLCGACPIPASSGKTTRHRLNRGGDRQANAALYRVVVVRMRGHQPTIDYVRATHREGKTKTEIIRCLKRFVAREIFGYLWLRRSRWLRPSKPLDRHRSINAPTESFLASPEKENVHHVHFRTRAEARAAVLEDVEILHDRQRLHPASGCRTPAEARAGTEGTDTRAAA